MRNLRLPTQSALLAGLTVATGAMAMAPRTAEACGGTFCDSGPTSMPVDQSGENVIFVMEPGFVEAHIQIQYDPFTEAENFAWVIPVQVLPEFSVGSEPFFDAVLAATVPRYGFNTTNDVCSDPSDTGDEVSSGGDTSAETSGDGDGDGPSGPSVVYRDTVGAFDITVLQGGSIEEVMMWLADNGYQQDPAAMPILGEYLEEGFLFAAMKLTHTAGMNSIHPITLRMATDEACVPLRLTAIAATEDMDVRTFFFGDERVIPTNYRHVEVNPLKIDWRRRAINYKEVVTLAVDADGADGNAFVTEYAGNDAVVNLNGVYTAAWGYAADGLVNHVDTPVNVMPFLESGRLMECFDDWDYEYYYDDPTCYAAHPLMGGLLNRYLPVPEGVAAKYFYGCLSCYEAQIDLQAWDAAAFEADIRELIVAPGERAAAIVAENPYITRMYTTISDMEMNEDPIFRPNPDLEPVPSLRIADRQVHCDGSAHMTLPDGRVVYMPDSNIWPDIFPDQMPWEETVQAGTLTGALMPLVEQTETINQLLTEWNKAGEPEDQLGIYGACTCSSADGEGGGAALASLGFLGLLGLRVRRRRVGNRTATAGARASA